MQMAQKYDIMYVNFYTDGSAARKVAPAFPEIQTKRKPKAAKHKKILLYIDPVAVCSIVVAVVLLVMMTVGLTRFQQARAEAQMMENYLQQLTEQNQALQVEYGESVNLEEVEKTALALGMVPKEQVPSYEIYIDARD